MSKSEKQETVPPFFSESENTYVRGNIKSCSEGKMEVQGYFRDPLDCPFLRNREKTSVNRNKVHSVKNKFRVTVKTNFESCNAKQYSRTRDTTSPIPSSPCNILTNLVPYIRFAIQLVILNKHCDRNKLGLYRLLG